MGTDFWPPLYIIYTLFDFLYIFFIYTYFIYFIFLYTLYTFYMDTSERKLLTNMVRTFDEESLICSLFDKKRQNLFLTWENTMAFDTT